MSSLLTFFDPTNPTSGNFVATFTTGCGTLHIKNASAVDVTLSLDNSTAYSYVVQAGEPRDIPVPKSRSTVYWFQQGKLNTNTKQIQSVVYVEIYEKGETIPASQALPRHNNPTNIGFQASDDFVAASAVNPCAINVFNPANSGVNGVFYSTRFFSNDSAPPGGLILPEIAFIKGADLSFPTPVAFINNHLVGGPATAMHCTENDGSHALPASTIFEQAIAQINVVYEFIPFPDQIEVPPGYNFLLLCSTSVGKVFAGSLRWTETPV